MIKDELEEHELVQKPSIDIEECMLLAEGVGVGVREEFAEVFVLLVGIAVGVFVF